MASSSRASNLKKLSEGARVFNLDDDDEDVAFEPTDVPSLASFVGVKNEPRDPSPEAGATGNRATETRSTGRHSESADLSRRAEIRPDTGDSSIELTDGNGPHHLAVVTGFNMGGVSNDDNVVSSRQVTPRIDSTGTQESEITQLDIPHTDAVLLSSFHNGENSMNNGIDNGGMDHVCYVPAGTLNDTTDSTSHQHSEDIDPEAGKQLETPRTLSGTSPYVDLGSSIFQRKTDGPVPIEVQRQRILEQQREMAGIYTVAASTNQRREDERAATFDDDTAIYQYQQIGQVEERPFDFELEHKEMIRKHAQRKATGLTTSDEEVRFLRLESKYDKQKSKVNREFQGFSVESDEDEDQELFVGYKSKATGKARRKTKRKYASSDSDQDYQEPQAKKAKAKPSKRSKTTRLRKTGSNRPGQMDHNSLGLSHILEDAQAAEGLREEQPGWTESDNVGQNRANALRALMRNVPADSLATARTDKTILNEALKMFTGARVKPAEGGKWLVPGMVTSLTPHQVLGASFMRQREARAGQPRGGILADQMGLGKTLMALANIVNGRPNRNIAAGRGITADQRYTTLVVVPPALLTQWKGEIKKHVVHKRRSDGWGLGRVVDYSERACPDLDLEELYDYDIVLTTYGEVSRSWPVIDMPELEEGEDQDRWWQENFYEKRGILHKAKFLRVCLDEAHCIRNPETRTSQACRNLNAEHCWAITGTPMVNGSFDLYALFEFIKHPTVKCPSGFRRNYVDIKKPMSVEKFSDDLSSCMNRFTHRDQLFGARLVNLPKARGKTIRLNFTRLEFAIYEIVRTRFATRVQQMSDEGNLRSKLTHIWVLMLRLRQLTAHPLMIQGEICSCLEREDFERLDRLCKRESSVRGDGANLILSIRNVLHKARAGAEKIVAEDHQDGADEQYQISLGTAIPRERAEGDLEGSGRAHGRNMRFDKYLHSIKSSATYRRINRTTKCCVCQQPPHEPYITDCFHFYCKVCLEDSQFEAAENGHDRASCATCGKEMTSQPTEAIVADNDGDDDEDEGSQGPQQRKKNKKKSQKAEDMSNWLDMKGEILPSTKTIATKAQILNWWDPLAGGDPNVKIIIFTQWLGMVKVLSKMCETEKWGYCTLIGDFSVKKRDAELKRFRTNPDTKILISSLRCGGLGLNLTVASKVIIIDPWWNDATEQQAFCRVFRIGQDRETSMVNLAIRNSIDERLFELKDVKKTEIDKVMLDHRKRHKVDLRSVLSVFGNLEEDERGRLYYTDLNPGANTSDDGE